MEAESERGGVGIIRSGGCNGVACRGCDGVTQGALSALDMDGQPASGAVAVGALAKFALQFGVDLDWLLEGSGPCPPVRRRPRLTLIAGGKSA